MAKSKGKLFTQKEIRELLKPEVEKIKDYVQRVSESAISMFYADYTPGKYVRTFSFHNLKNVEMRYHEKDIKNGIKMTFTYDAWDVGVSGNGDPDWAFDAGFIHGFHGGPHKVEGGQLTWNMTPRMNPSPWDTIAKYVSRL